VNRTLAVIALAVLAAFGVTRFIPVLDSLENRLLDGFVRHQAAKLTPDPEIVLVDIDENSLLNMKEAGRFPWPREVYATLIDGLAAQKPRAIVFDIMFSEPDRFRPESDAAFVESAARYDNVFFPMVWLDSKDGERAAEVASMLGLIRGANADPDARIAVIPPAVLPPKLWRAGTINFLADADGVGRRYWLRHRVGGWDLPSLPARIAMELGYPLPNSSDILLAWRGRSEGFASFTSVSFVDLYQDFDRSKPVRPIDEFKGKIVIIGARAAGLGDLRVTPLSSTQPGSEMLATAIDNLKNGRQMRYASAAWGGAIGIALVFLLYLGFQRRLDARVIGGTLVAASAALILASYLAVGELVLLPLLGPLLAAWTFYVAAALSEYLREREARREVVAQFSRFVNPEVVKQLVERGGIQGAGQTRDVTLLFSDIRGFTTLSENRRPDEVVALLNRYFSMQVDVVFHHNGSLDKFIGDCIMAIWGAPLDDRDHARHAVACALDMADTLAVFKREFGEGAKDFDVGIGVHSGPAVVGLIGSEKRREYTAIGDTVNVASRIEGQTKEAKRRILVSRDTMQRCGDAFDFEPAGSYKPKGRAQEVELFEPKRKTT
jgi:adenylate cyclase